MKKIDNDRHVSRQMVHPMFLSDLSDRNDGQKNCSARVFSQFHSYVLIRSIIAVFQFYVRFVMNTIEIFVQTIEKKRKEFLRVVLLEICES